MKKPTLRSSSLPLFMTCSNALLNPDSILRVETENETSLLGTLVHAQAESTVKHGTYDLEGIRDRVSPDDYGRAVMLFNNFLTVWRQAAVHMTEPVTEYGFSVELRNVVVTGHIDVHHTDAKRAFVLDYKTGRQHEDHYHQMAAYAFGVWDKAGRPENFVVYVTSVYLEDNSISPYTFTAERLAAWAEEVAAQVDTTRYTAGRKCAFCTLQGACPAYRDYTAGSLAVLRGEAPPPKVWEEMTPEERGDVMDRIYVIEKAIDRVKLTHRNVVKKLGRLAAGKNTEYVLRAETLTDIDPARALPILKARLGPAGVEKHTQFNLNAVLGAYAQRAAKGQKGKARKELFEELDAAGAIVRVSSTKTWRRPVDEAVMEGTP